MSPEKDESEEINSMRVVFWQNILSFYQVPHITALAADPGTEVVWVVQQAISPDRVAQGWKVPDVPGVRKTVSIFFRAFIKTRLPGKRFI